LIERTGRIVLGLSDAPDLGAVDPGDFEARSVLAEHEAKSQREDVAGEGLPLVRCSNSDEDELALGQPLKFESPGLGVEDQDLAGVDLGVEVEFLTGQVSLTEDHDGEIGTSAKMRSAIPRRVG
jgi:hypothetical protein